MQMGDLKGFIGLMRIWVFNLFVAMGFVDEKVSLSIKSGLAMQSLRALHGFDQATLEHSVWDVAEAPFGVGGGGGGCVQRLLTAASQILHFGG